MRIVKIRLGSSFVTSAFAIMAAVGICFATLLFLRPWPQHRAADAITPTAHLDDAKRATKGNIAEFRAEPPADAAPDAPGATPRADAEPEQAAPTEQAALQPGPAAQAPAAETSIVEPKEAEIGEPRAPEQPATSETTAAGAASEPEPADSGALFTAATPMPKPGAQMTKAEMDEALRPILSYDLSAEDIKNLKEVVRLVQKDDFAPARILMGKLSDPGAQKLAQWYYYRNGAYDATPDELAAFRESNPLWPDRAGLEDRVEEALFWREQNPAKILSYYRERRPVSGPGKAALGGALIATGRTDEGRSLIRTAWRQHLLTPAIETRLKDKFAETLRPEDHKARLDWLLVRNRKNDLKTIERMVPLIDKKWEPAVKAQIAFIKGEKNAGTLLSGLDSAVKDDPAVLLARIQWARRNDKDEQVWELLRSAPTDGPELVNPLSWWDQRETQIRNALNGGNPKMAYALAQGYAGSLPAEELSDAAFLAGWLALRFMNEPKAAHKHLLTSAAAGGLPKHRARAGYWLGRTELVLGNKRSASARFADAAQYTHTFYGQLARQMAEPRITPFAMRPYARPSKADIRAFTRNPVIMALGAANKAGLEGLVPVFTYDLARQITSPPEMTLACELASRLTGPDRAVRMAKIAMNRGFPVELYAYPDVLPDFKMLADGDALEEPLIHALTRQESEFNPTIVSSAGAMGLMQLLPSTAKEVAKAHDLKFDKKKLMSDPSYNLSLGSAFLHRLIRNYDGSYIMALAAYNAGPGRVRQWVALFGDPREKKVDPVDWIERIPFTETREYVLKIMESAQVYRARLNRKGDTLRLAQDLHRGRDDTARSFMEAGMH
jgi:soluble lytic murein transglycosylase